MDEQAATRRKRQDRHHPTGLCDVGESLMCFLGGVRLSEAAAVNPDRFAPWRQQTGNGFPRWFPVCQTCFPVNTAKGRPGATTFTDMPPLAFQIYI